jgi:hypothetical protein
MKPTVNDMVKVSAKAEENWKSIWQEILERPDGTIDINQLKLQLLDFSELIERMTDLTGRLTRGTLSYPTYPVDTIMEVHERVLEEEREQEEQDKRNAIVADIDADEDEYVCHCFDDED